jgi:hypothetical protein
VGTHPTGYKEEMTMRHIVSGLLVMVFLFAGSVQGQAPKGWVPGKGIK